ncbi:unnamed protein product, partial [Medioppia subpectinata]
VIAEHRQEQVKSYGHYEVVQDVKGQTTFLQELDRIEKRRHEEQEREVLIKAAKSRSKADDPDHIAIKQRAKEMQRQDRSKADDPDHIAIKQRAKEMQRQELEELRQREANETALQAIGMPRKRLKTSLNSTATNSPGGGAGASGSPFGATQSAIASSLSSSFTLGANRGLKPMRRIKRVSLKDLHFLMETEKDTVRRPILYKAYLK